MKHIRTDLAVEAREMYQENTQENTEIDGVVARTRKLPNVTVTHVEVVSEQGAQSIGKPVGNYITLEIPKIRQRDMQVIKDSIIELANELRNLIQNNDCVLVCGLGNYRVTPDALGPKVLHGILITRHLYDEQNNSYIANMQPVCGISPGVLGTTGIETGEIIRGVAERVKPSVIIAIDALASRKVERVSTTIQIADTGITPGSGIGNTRNALNRETLGVPVIAIGVPTVVDAATITGDTIEKLINEMKNGTEKNSKLYEFLENVNEEDKYALIKEVLTPYDANLFVTPKDVDMTISDISKVISTGINMALQPSLTLNDALEFANL